MFSAETVIFPLPIRPNSDITDVIFDCILLIALFTKLVIVFPIGPNNDLTSGTDDWILAIALQTKLAIVSSYSSGLITELMGKMMIENKAYQGVASITSRVWRQQTVTKGTQQQKSVAIIIEIFRCNFAFRSFTDLLSLPCVNKSFDDLVDIRLMEI